MIARALVNRELNKGTLFAATLGSQKLCSQVAEMTDIFLPNSISEMQRVRNDFSVSQNKFFVVVPNSVDTSVFDWESSPDLCGAGR